MVFFILLTYIRFILFTIEKRISCIFVEFVTIGIICKQVTVLIKPFSYKYVMKIYFVYCIYFDLCKFHFIFIYIFFLVTLRRSRAEIYEKLVHACYPDRMYRLKVHYFNFTYGSWRIALRLQCVQLVFLYGFMCNKMKIHHCYVSCA